MRLTSAICALLFTEVALGAKLTEKRRANRAARQLSARSGGTRKSHPRIAASVGGAETNTSNVDYSYNWAGAVVDTTGVTEVTGTVVVPTLSGSTSNTESAGSAWVGIDGDTDCPDAILQTGFDWYVEGSSVSYDAWYEWYPAYASDFSDITIAAGDSIKMTVVASSTTSGTATIENLTTGQTVTETFTDVTDGSLCEYDAEWIVEDFEECGTTCEFVPFADFGTVTFTDATAVVNGATVTPADATILDIEQDEVLTSCSASSSEVTCTYV